MTADMPRRWSAGFLAGLSLVAMLLVTGFAALGVWQVHRLAWKRDLIARVAQRVHAAPIDAPRVATQADEYRRVVATGRFLHDKATLVQASTVRGPGYWVMTPMETDRGFILLVNRGFVPAQDRQYYLRPAGVVRVTGLVRLSEPKGGFLRSNDPTAGRWYSRDVAAIAGARRLSPIAGYFVDAEGDPATHSYPVPGLTVLRFPNNHFAYAITWFTLAAMTMCAYIFVMHQEWKGARK